MDKNKQPVKTKINIEEFNKNRAVREKNILKLKFPLAMKILFGVPVGYVLFLIIYFLAHARFIPEH